MYDQHEQADAARIDKLARARFVTVEYDDGTTQTWGRMEPLGDPPRLFRSFIDHLAR